MADQCQVRGNNLLLQNENMFRDGSKSALKSHRREVMELGLCSWLSDPKAFALCTLSACLLPLGPRRSPTHVASGIRWGRKQPLEDSPLP